MSKILNALLLGVVYAVQLAFVLLFLLAGVAAMVVIVVSIGGPNG